MGIESTVTLKRSDAIYRINSRCLEIIASVNNKTNDELEELVYSLRDTIFENYNVVDDNDYCDECNDTKLSWSHERHCLGKPLT